MVEPNIQFSMNDKAILGIPVHERNCEEILQNANSKKVHLQKVSLAYVMRNARKVTLMKVVFDTYIKMCRT